MTAREFFAPAGESPIRFDNRRFYRGRKERTPRSCPCCGQSLGPWDWEYMERASGRVVGCSRCLIQTEPFLEEM